MIEWSAVLAMALNGAPATVVILLVIWALKISWRFVMQLTPRIADGPDSQIGQHDKVREEPTLGSPRELDDADGEGKELRDAVMALSRRVAVLEKKMGQQAPGRMATQATSRSSNAEAATIVPLERPATPRRRINVPN